MKSKSLFSVIENQRICGIFSQQQMIIGKEETRNKLKEFAQNGGTVVMTYRSAVKDVDNN